MMTETIRAFLCVELSTEAKQALYQSTAPLRTSFPSLKWVKPECLHITLKYLGELKKTRIDSIAESMEQSLTPNPPASFDLRCGSLGAFPGFKRVRTLYAKVLGELESLSHLAAISEKAAVANGLPREKRPFMPHITLARSRNPEPMPPDDSFPGRPIEWNVSSVALMKSDLRPTGSVYTRIRIWRLGE
ncbi:MAG: RNA 2',3'-cyclic phosphodiesterase [Synergistaceae bacterium]|nr:RNA 2',3'-cyclic phosphodiesterase [Synergistota bacterium]NLM70593.1 RNA 2',3'-cyclic phosphodiesterase [Synergistaceae bacterium]